MALHFSSASSLVTLLSHNRMYVMLPDCTATSGAGSAEEKRGENEDAMQRNKEESLMDVEERVSEAE